MGGTGTGSDAGDAVGDDDGIGGGQGLPAGGLVIEGARMAIRVPANEGGVSERHSPETSRES